MATKKSTQAAPAASVNHSASRKVKASGTGRPEPRLAKLQMALRQADERIEMAYDAAEHGSALELLLEHTNHVLVVKAVRAMLKESPTVQDADATRDALMLVLAALEGCVALSIGTIVHGALVEALQLLDWAQDECEAIYLHRLLPESVPGAGFLRGRDIAINMLKAGGELGDAREGLRRYRGGKPQVNFVKGYLSEIIEEPALLDGFTSIMSATLRNDHVDLAELERITLSETEAGPVEEDGGQWGTIAGAFAAGPALKRAPRAASQAEPQRLTAEAVDVIYASVGEHSLTQIWGVHTLAKLARAAVDQAWTDAPERGLLEHASNELDAVLAVLNKVNDESLDCALLHAGESLLKMRSRGSMTAVQSWHIE